MMYAAVLVAVASGGRLPATDPIDNSFWRRSDTDSPGDRRRWPRAGDSEPGDVAEL